MMLPGVYFKDEVKFYSIDFSTFSKLNIDFNKIYDKEVLPKYSQVKLLELILMDDTFDKFKED